MFWHILTRLSYYRELHVRSAHLSEGAQAEAENRREGGQLQGSNSDAAWRRTGSGQLDGASAPATTPSASGGRQGSAQPAGVVVVSEVDTFSQRLNAILASDMTQVRRSGQAIWVWSRCRRHMCLHCMPTC